ncbi:autotransporter [Bacillus pseudomycoides]|uniref:autotransporter n=1 Tax=Bacillus pseudomycoides TaxID=64104 RepID=UPI000BEB65F9|nr:autotransporter [Bacillus pseudomycoides]PED06129.1 autotransporter [Bacillus pseudomycoides]PEI95572.1 autotransporter [Bacillus pseudomycoides]PEK29994.1 autotransporter [Bacillus pseudomycoides]PEM70423.1 autotransporter [Bacillus pseudomycoides]PEO07950.1 autotransporter [Bacillus pseudomycoides]
MKKYISIALFFIVFGLLSPFSNIYAETSNTGINKNDEIANVFNNGNLEEKISYIKSSNLNNWSVTKINQILDRLDNLNLGIMERATLKREIIRQAGFSNFDFKGTNSDVLAFKELKIEIIETEEPLVLYRRSKAGEPESKYGLGYWWGDKERSIEETRNELAVLEAWGNPLSTAYKIQVPKGTKMLKGVTASQTQYLKGTNTVQEYREGGAMQYWINKVSNSWLQ